MAFLSVHSSSGSRRCFHSWLAVFPTHHPRLIFHFYLPAFYVRGFSTDPLISSISVVLKNLMMPKASSQCIPNYMFLLEAQLSCLASPFVNVARLGPNQHPESPAPDPPTAQNYHYPTILASRLTTVMPGMTRTRLSDLCVWLVLSQQQAVLSQVECECHAEECGAGVFGSPGLSL